MEGDWFPWWFRGKASASNAGDVDSIPGSGRSLGAGCGNTLRCSCQENPMDRGAWQATVHGAKKSDTTAVTEHARTWREITSFHIFATVNRATINIVVQILYGHDLVTKQQQHFTGIISILKPKLQSSYSCFMDEESNSVICLSLHSKQCMWMWI